MGSGWYLNWNQQLHCDASGTSAWAGVVTSISDVFKSPVYNQVIPYLQTRTLRGIPLCVLLHSWQRHRYLLEQTLHVVASLGRCLHEHYVELRGLFRSFFQCYLTSISDEACRLV